MNKTVPVETGCYIDGSHMSSFDFTAAVIEFAHDYGFELEYDQFVKDVNGIRDDLFTDDDIYDVMDALDWTYEDALEFLNSGLPDGLHYTVECNCLILEELDD
jgi:hypothetical protein